MQVRVAVDEDRLPVVGLMRRFHEASGVSLRFGAVHAESTFKACVAMPDRLCLVLADERPRGVFLAQAAPFAFGPDLIASEILWWIDEGHRGRGAAMLDAYEAWARQQGCSFASMVSLAGNDLTKLYERRGYRPAETHFIKAL